MTEEEAKRRFFTLVLLRFSGVALAFLGIAIVMRRLIEPADVIGTILIAVGAFQVLVLPIVLIKRWRRGVKRFWTDVTVEDGTILLDGRGVKTPARAALVLPNVALAEAVAEEWRAVGETVDPRAMPMTGLSNAAIDRVAPDPARFAADIAKYGETDLLCYRAEHPPELAAYQAEVWDPMLDWARARYDVAFAVTAGIVHAAQPPETPTRLAAAVASRNAFEFAALSPLVTIGGSLVVALMVAEAAVDADAAFDATHLDEIWQAGLWGEDALATQAREARRGDFRSAARFLSLVG